MKHLKNKKVLVINGPNLNLLGVREPEIYGEFTYEELCTEVEGFAQKLRIDCEFFQANGEGEIVDKLQETLKQEVDLIIINPGGYTHYSYAIADAIRAISVPAIEVHISNIYARENFRACSVIAPSCVGQISGLGAKSYMMALMFGREIW